jgi:RsiW-degrading membrane proteinase PrsW (M82 family)
MAGRGSWRRGVPVLGLTWRQVTLAAAISMSVGVAVALYVEAIGSLYAVTVLLVHSGAFETARDLGIAWDRIGEADFRLSDNEQFVAGLFTASVLAPLSEEFGKSLGVRFMMRPNSTRAQCFLLGAFAGAGFAFLEALLYGLGGISEGSLSSWWAIMLLRGGSTSLHVLCTGLAGLGWWYWSLAKRHRTALGLFGTAMLIHAAWNAFATIISSRIIYLDTIDSTVLAVIAYVVITVVSLSMTAAIPLVAKGLRERIPPPEGTPLGSMAPWLG